MTFRRIVTAMDGGRCGSRALSTALALAKAFSAHVDAVHVRVDPIDTIPFAGEGVSGALVQELIEQTTAESEARAVAGRAEFDATCAALGVRRADLPDPQHAVATAAWRESVGREEETLIRLGRVADLLVVGRTEEATDDPGAAVALSAALFGTGHPVLVSGTEAPRFDGVMVVAWSGSIEAARAVTAALPLLTRAQRVRALVASDDSGRGHDEVSDVAEYLAWHGIDAERLVVAPKPSVAEALLAASADACLLVMGSYSHSRLRELILGGVTRHMLDAARVPLLLAH